jgi:metal-responsive CopG/Arc/MetJ family transcriptional regulator
VVRVITFKIDEELLDKLDLYAMNNKLFRSEVIREAIKLYLSIKKNSIEENLRNKTVVREL